jgi:hypothetical protein
MEIALINNIIAGGNNLTGQSAVREQGGAVGQDSSAVMSFAETLKKILPGMDAQESLATSTLKTQLDEVLALQGLNNSGNVNIAANIVGVGSTLISFDEASLLPMQEVEFIDTQQVSQVTSVMTAEVNSVIQSNQDIIDSTQQQILSQAQTNSAMDKKDALELIQQNIQQANNKAPDGNSIHNEKQNKLKAQNKNLPVEKDVNHTKHSKLDATTTLPDLATIKDSKSVIDEEKLSNQTVTMEGKNEENRSNIVELKPQTENHNFAANSNQTQEGLNHKSVANGSAPEVMKEMDDIIEQIRRERNHMPMDKNSNNRPANQNTRIGDQSVNIKEIKSLVDNDNNFDEDSFFLKHTNTEVVKESTGGGDKGGAQSQPGPLTSLQANSNINNLAVLKGATSQYQNNSIDNHNAELQESAAKQVGLKIIGSLKSNKSSMQVKLQPAELGSVDIKMEVSASGNTKLHISVEKIATLDMLQRSSETLQKMLDDSGIKSENNSLDFSLKDQNSGQGQQQQEQPKNMAKANAFEDDLNETIQEYELVMSDDEINIIT